MADLQNFSITPRSATNVNVPRAEIVATVVDSMTGAVLADFTGANSIMFPGVVSTLSADDRRELAEMIGTWLVMKKAGLST